MNTGPEQMQSGQYPDDMITNLEYTYTLDKLSCFKPVWYVHVTFALLVCCSGLGCLFTRIWFKHLHVYFGRLYIICMLWCMGTSLVIHNTGLPIAVLISFIWVLGGLTVGWILIKMHQKNLERKAAMLFNEKLRKNENRFLERLRLKEITEIIQKLKIKIQRKKIWMDRILSYKAAHGTLMFMSFINIFGRIFGVNLSEGFTCHTYPYYKQLNSPKFEGLGKPLTHVPIHDQNYTKLPWANGLGWWGLELSAGPIVFALMFGCIFAFTEVRYFTSKRKKLKESDRNTCFSNIRILAHTRAQHAISKETYSPLRLLLQPPLPPSS